MKINPEESAGHPKSTGPGQLPLLFYPCAGAGEDVVWPKSQIWLKIKGYFYKTFTRIVVDCAFNRFEISGI